MLMTHLGSGIWSYTSLNAGAILFVNVPATIRMSDCLGEPRKMIPSLSWSYRGIELCIISMPQQARPKETGHNEPLRAQLMIWSIEVLGGYVSEIFEGRSALLYTRRIRPCPYFHHGWRQGIDDWEHCPGLKVKFWCLRISFLRQLGSNNELHLVPLPCPGRVFVISKTARAVRTSILSPLGPY
jgi:hypothetical protein